MPIKRLLFVVVGLVVAGLAVLLVLWGLNASRSDPVGSGDAIVDSPADTTPEDGGASGGESRKWQEFTGGAEQDSEQMAPDLRPIERQTRSAGKPFNQAYAQRLLGSLRFRLEGVGRGEQPLALISGRVLRIGDHIEGYRIESIDRSGVLLIGPSGMRLDLALQMRSSAQGNLAAGSNDRGGARAGGPQGSVWRSEDGLRARPYFPDGRPDIVPTDPNIRIKEMGKNADVPWDRYTPYPLGPYPQPPSAYFERDSLGSGNEQ